MLKNYLKTAFRNLIKQPFYTLINLLGLAVGVACCLLILMYVQEEMSFDKHHEKYDQIYRMTADIKFNTDQAVIPQLPAPLAKTMVQDFPEVLAAFRFRTTGNWLVKRKDQEDARNIKEEDGLYVDQEIFDVFDLPIVAGDQASALTEPNTMMISQRMAEKYFPGENPIGQILTLDNDWDNKITAVFQNLPSSSHFQFDFGLAMASRDEAQQAVWVSHNFHTYFVLQEGADPKKLEAKFPQLMETYVGPQVKELLNFSMEEFAENGNRIKYNLEPLSEVYLHSPITTDLGKEGDFSNVILFGAIALFILLLACINFMNLSTARSANRAKEVGMRKVFGSLKGQLVIQFLMESVMLSLTAFLLAIAFAEAILPFFNQMADKSLQIPYTSAGFILAIVMGSGILGVLSGLYPAFYLSRFEPARVLKGKLATGASNSWIRKGLVVFQFATTIALLVSTFIVYQQMSFIQNKNLGFDKEQVVMIHDAWQLGDKVQTFKEELLSFPQVTHATASSYLPVSNTNRNNTVFWEEGKQDGESQILLQSWRVDHDYLSTLGMEIVQGRDFSIEMSTDSLGLILNEQAVRNFGLEEPLGARISTFDFLSSPQDPAIVTFTVIGVVKDFHFESLKEDITGLAFYIGRSTGYISARVNSSELGPTLAMMEEKWETFLPGQPFETSFLDERFSRMYAATIQQRDIFTAFATLAILVACLGLFALASFIAEQRQKEIGIRKVMGASISQIIILLNQDFAKLVIIALILAAAPTWYFMEQWLSNFQYRIDINVWVFLGAGLLALVIAIITVSSQSIRAAIMDPVDSIRDE